jgi:hypothetical protein
VGQPILGRDQYNEVFSDPARRRAALERALDIRKFEIGLYWERAKYFWTLLIAAFSGYFLLAANDKYNLLFLVSSIGLVVSTGWYLVNRGSKHWQENWERHVDALEEDELGPLYKTTIADEEFSWWKLNAGYPYSVSKINQIVSLYVVVVWFAFFVMSLLWLAFFFVIIVRSDIRIVYCRLTPLHPLYDDDFRIGYYDRLCLCFIEIWS